LVRLSSTQKDVCSIMSKTSVMDDEKDIWEEDLYDLLKIHASATEKEINTAYRKQALRVHPDKNPDNVEATKLFHRLKRAYELLKDPTKRNRYHDLQRLAAMDEQRRRMRDDLERREEAVLKKRYDEHHKKHMVSETEVG
jgi:DnaJ family protein C protein 17